MASQLEYVLRERTPADDPLIYSAWTEEARTVEPFSWIPSAVWRRHQRDHIRTKLGSGTTLVICHPDDPNELMGFVCYSELDPLTLAIHWIYVKSICRRVGLGRSVFESLPEHTKLYATQLSNSFLWIKKLTGAVYHPWA